MKRILTLGAAAAMALGSATAAGPAVADTSGPAGISQSLLSEAPDSGSIPAGSGVSSTGLADAVSRDLGLTSEDFNAAGELGRQAAGVAEALSGVPGYAGTRLQDGRILVSGTGPELAARVAELARNVPLLALEPAAPPVAGSTTKKTGPSPAAVGSAAPAETAASAAEAESASARGTELAVSTRQLFESFVREVGPHDLQAVAFSRGKFVIRTGAANAAESSLDGASADSGSRAESSGTTGSPTTGSPTASAGKVSANDFVARFANVELEAGTDLAPEADIVGGQGYVSDTREICSTGFAAFDPAGLPSVLTAGHCSDDGTAQQATLEPSQGAPAGVLGSFGFSQFGGPANSPILGDEANPGNVGTDVAVIGSLRAGLEPQPAASTWDDPSLAEDYVKIIGTAAPVGGQPVCRSGR
ncbi:MAG: hypothetical protein JWQ75_4298, partial [Pseudarthrobacter sp.]|nr:hypothetical protein [Pseudarthrobacter sp.]